MKYPAKEIYQDETIVNKYDDKRFKNLKGRLVDAKEKSLIIKALNFIKASKNSRILDIPCGTGRLSFYLAEKGYNIVGCDVSPAMIKRCNEKKARYNKSFQEKIKFQVNDAENLEFSDNYFDAVVSLRLFGHLPPDIRKKVLNEMRRVTNSYIIVAYYHKNSLQYLIRKKCRESKKIHWNPVTLKEIDRELKSVGLKRVKRFFLLPFISETIVVLAKK